MNVIPQRDLISVEDYLAGELESDVKHEYLGGYVYAMAGAKNKHNRLGARIIGSLYGQLRDSSCEVYTSDTKVYVDYPKPRHERFYYPDVVVVCDSSDDEQSYQENPVLIAEVISDSTRRTDEIEKLDAYRTIPSLRLYLLVEPDVPRIVVHRRVGDEFKIEQHEGLEATIPLPEIDAQLPLRDLYQSADAQS